MPIDVETRDSPGWWLQRCTRRLVDRKRSARLAQLAAYHDGDPPLPEAAAAWREAFRELQRRGRTNFAELIVSAVRERMIFTDFRTAVDDDETGDAEAGRNWRRACGQIITSDVHELMFSLGEAYVIVGPVEDDTGVPLVTAEDPRQMVGIPDPRMPRRLLAAAKLLRDEAGEQRAYLYMPGRTYVARRPDSAPRSPDELLVHPDRHITFSPGSWEWVEDAGGEKGQDLGHKRMPVVPFVNKGGKAEIEPHLDLLDRINHTLLQRMIITSMQAFRQRAVRGMPDTDEEGNEIDYEELFTSEPGALWQLPEGADMWESGQADLTPVLASVRDDVLHLSAVTRTPFTMLMPDGANQSAEGASLQREGLVFKAEDRIARVDPQWATVQSLIWEVLKDSNRADMARLEVLWRPAERLSLAERADAASKLPDVPWRTKMIHIMGFTPAAVDRMDAERAADQLRAATLAGGPPQTATSEPAVPAEPGGQPDVINDVTGNDAAEPAAAA